MMVANRSDNTCKICKSRFGSVARLNDHVTNLRAFVIAFCERCGSNDCVERVAAFCAICRRFISGDFWTHECLHQRRAQRLAGRRKRTCESCRKVTFFGRAHHCSTVDCRASSKDDDNSSIEWCQFVCRLCHTDCRTLEGYREHLVQIHFDLAQFPDTSSSSTVSCRFCVSHFSNRNAATAHERKSHGDELVDCPKCSKRVRVARMKAHNTTHRTRECYRNAPLKICNVCGVSVKNLSRHLITHGDERRFECSICEKRFKLAWDMKKHVARHESEAKHGCEVCGKAFKNAYNLRVHARSHDNVKPFACLVCQRTFTTKQSRNVHLMIHNKMS